MPSPPTRSNVSSMQEYRRPLNDNHTTSRNGSPLPNARSSNRRYNTRRPNANADNNEGRCFLINNLDRRTLAGTIHLAFAKFGEISRVQINLDANESPDGTAVILFNKLPEDLEFLRKPVKVDGCATRVEPHSDTFRDDTIWRESRRMNWSRVQAQSFAMGTLTKPREFMEEWKTTNDVSMAINYDMRQIQIFFTHLDEKYRLEFKFKDIQGDLNFEKEETSAFTIALRYPACFWRQNVKAIKETKTSVIIGDQWERVIHIPRDAAAAQKPTVSLDNKPEMPLVAPERLKLGTWIVYRLTFEYPQRSQPQFEKLLSDAANYNLVPRDTSHCHRFLDVVEAKNFPKPIDHAERGRQLSFDVLYLLECNILSYHLNEHNLTPKFYSIISQLDPSIACGILELLALDKKRIWDPTKAMYDLWKQREMKVCQPRKIPKHCALVRKIIVSPTSIYLQPPVVETTNRVIRHYQDHADRFIRVQFVDEGFGRISASHTGLSNDALYNHIFKVLQRGIQVGTRRYDFLAFSSSQLREHGCWFFAPTEDLTPNQIRAWMGDFSHEKIVAKHAVRIGQCFSSTRPITSLEKHEVDYIDDVVRDGYTFSDGVGKISSTLAQEVMMQMELKTVPSAFQFRFSGAKGVLTKSNFLSGRKIQLRPSQMKFESQHNTLEIIRYSTLIPAYLNRQIITLLSTLGVEDAVFIDKVQKMREKMDQMLENPGKAIRVLMSNVDEFGTARSMARIIQAGFLEKRDPYIVNMLNMFRVSMLKDLKKKAKIHVPKGAFLLGVMDETLTLQENEVFCQISVENTDVSGQTTGTGKRVITGDVVVFRNPCFHPGDVRVVKAVDCENLHHLTDVLVFSAQGYRDVPSMCSGGDLDGDDYSIIWDETLMPKTKNYPPMDYKVEEPRKVSEVKISDIVKFFVNYINNDNLGQIANAHLATADRSPIGALDGACIRLAQLHSLAVDFPKSGKPAKLDDELRVRVFPDFMQKKDKESYPSQKVLGQIYRSIDKATYGEYKNQLLDNAQYDVRLRVPGMERYIAEARQLKEQFDRDLLALMNQYGVQTEAEIISGYVIKWLKKGNKKSKHEIHKQTMAAVSNMRHHWRKEFEREFVGDDANYMMNMNPNANAKPRDLRHNVISGEARVNMEAKAAAWYYVTYHPEERRRNLSPESRFLSFPWVIDDYLCEITMKYNSRVPKEDQAKPVDDALVEELGRKHAGNKAPFHFSFREEVDDETSSSGEESSDENDEALEEYDARGQTTTVTLSEIRAGGHASNSPLSTTQDSEHSSGSQQGADSTRSWSSPRDQSGHLSLIPADATDEEMLKVLLG